MEVRLKTSADNQIYVLDVGGSHCSVSGKSTVLETYAVVSYKYFSGLSKDLHACSVM